MRKASSNKKRASVRFCKLLVESSVVLMAHQDYWQYRLSRHDDPLLSKSMVDMIACQLENNVKLIDDLNQGRFPSDYAVIQEMITNTVTNTAPRNPQLRIIQLLVVAAIVLFVLGYRHWFVYLALTVAVAVTTYNWRQQRHQVRQRGKVRCLLSVECVEQNAGTPGEDMVHKAWLLRRSPQYIPFRFRTIYKTTLAEALAPTSEYSKSKQKLERFYTYFY
ncbi:hypothetical protein DIURU_000788 [Diutina rugosa]|uniref:Uncharacterized protein n=1 Tax=Diutina rugosa TaxID=5481 RepID=A0A642UYQ7_DIURU|nr:uncharacterized protein DIURU_000788 [Diutina rugosa]KAA8907104.1 hypothetical protein DIURU_000788 [Diutina rugosa]